MGDYIGAKSAIGTDETYYYLLFWLIINSTWLCLDSLPVGKSDRLYFKLIGSILFLKIIFIKTPAKEF